MQPTSGTTAPTTLPPQTGFFGHPAGLRTLFFTELWERFSFYGLRAILVLFMTTSLAMGGLGWSVEKAGPIYGMYASLVYLSSLPGGWIADRLIGQRRAVFLGGAIIMFGHISLAVPSQPTFFLGLFLIIVGTGLLKPNVSTMVGQLYAPADERRDGGFSVFYMGINLGAMIAPLVTSGLAQSAAFKARLAGWGISPENSWHWGFGAAAVGMFCGLAWYLIDSKALGDAGRLPAVTGDADAHSARATFGKGVLLALALVVLLFGLNASGIMSVTPDIIAGSFKYILPATVVAFFSWLFFGGNWTHDERNRLIAITVLFFGAVVFWSVFEQAASTLTLFADRSTRNVVLGMHFTSGSWQSVNSAFIVLLSPVFGWLWVKLGSRNPSSTAKFAVGLFFASLSFVVMVPAAALAAGGNRVGWIWLTLSYLFATIGELCLSPVGLSAMTRLAPPRVASLMMGVWFLATSVGNFIAGNMAGLYESLSPSMVFTLGAAFAMLFAIILAVLVKPIRRMLEGNG
jgi:POT family proton-dependent oligopeptide transporter